MNLNEVTALLTFLAVAVLVALAVHREARTDGYGRRPPPRSRYDEQETRNQVLHRLA